MNAGGFNAGLSFDRSYYLATADPPLESPTLRSEIRADVCIVGGGCTGLSAALHAAQAGLSVVVLEGGQFGWGASGRNGGQIIPGLRLGALDLIARYGREEAKALFDVAHHARDLVVDLIADQGISCDLKLTGHLSAAVRLKDMEHYRREADALATVMNYPHVSVLEREGVANELAAPGYCGGLLDGRGGHLHPLNYSLGLARAARAAGASLFEQSVVLDVEAGRPAKVRTTSGVVTAEHVVLAGDALLGPKVGSDIAGHIMPVASYIVATAPLADPAALIPRDRAVSDSRFAVNYFRLSADGRLLFGGGERYTRTPPRDIADFAGAHMRRVFPQLKTTTIDYAWGGLVSITRSRLPHIGRHGPIYFAHGYSGLGAILSTLAGKLIVQALTGACPEFDRLVAAAPPAMPGGTLLRAPLHMLGMLWYALRDRL